MSTSNATDKVPEILIDLVSPKKKQRFSDRTVKSRVAQTSLILLTLNAKLKKKVDKNNPKLAKQIENLKDRIKAYESHLDEILSNRDKSILDDGKLTALLKKSKATLKEAQIAGLIETQPRPISPAIRIRKTPTPTASAEVVTNESSNSSEDEETEKTLNSQTNRYSSSSSVEIQIDDSSEDSDTSISVNDILNLPLTMAAAPTADDWRNFADANTQALIQGMNNLNAITFKREIPEFTGDLDDGVTIDEWLKTANRVAVVAGWTDDQKLRYFQDRLRKSAANFNDSLTQQQRDTFQHWETAMVTEFQDSAVRSLRKAQLKHLKQKHSERIRDFKKRIDDTYKTAYGDAVANSRDREVALLRNEIKKEVFLNGIRPQIATIIWSRLIPNATYDETVQTATECEQIIEFRRVTEVVNPNATVGNSTDKTPTQEGIDGLKQVIEQLANLKLTENKSKEKGVIAYTSDRNESHNRERNRQRSRSTSSNYSQRSYTPSSYNNNRKSVRFADNRKSRSPSPGFSRTNGSSGKQFYKQPSSTQYKERQTGKDNNRGRETRSCYFCGIKGHIKLECRKYAKWRKEKQN